jgi:metal-sulfur cluster biosynthetic enzyme
MVVRNGTHGGTDKRLALPHRLDEERAAWTGTTSGCRDRDPSSMISESDIFAALRDCFDPEVKLNLVDLGLIYAVETGPDPNSTPKWPRQWVKVTMTLTTPQCPASGLIFEQVHNRLASIPDISKVDVDLVWEPKWTAHRISEAGRRQLGI